ncbi:unnamed protein product, partial [Heterotrigona itama]
MQSLSILEQQTNIKKGLRQFRANITKNSIMWIPTHIGIESDEMTDKEVKTALAKLATTFSAPQWPRLVWFRMPLVIMYDLDHIIWFYLNYFNNRKTIINKLKKYHKTIIYNQ